MMQAHREEREWILRQLRPFAGLHLLKDIATQIGRERCIRIGEAFILADEAAQLLRQRLEANFLGAIPEWQRIDRVREHRDDEAQRDCEHAKTRDHFAASFFSNAMRGKSSVAMTSGVIGLMYL